MTCFIAAFFKKCLPAVSVSLSALIIVTPGTYGQQVPQGLSDSLFSTYYQQRVSLFRLLPHKPHQIVFLGNSITDGGEWDELFADRPDIINRGISGDLTAGVLNRLDEVTGRKPAKIFLLIGTNDLARGLCTDSILYNINLIAELVHKSSPFTRLYIQSIFPVNPCYHMFAGHTANTGKIKTINNALAAGAAKAGYTYIDVFDALKGPDGLMDPHITNDGLHLKGAGYMRWKHVIYPYVMDVTTKPALLPAPKNISWQKGVFPLYDLQQITYIQDSLKDLALRFSQTAQTLPQGVPVGQISVQGKPEIQIQCVRQLNSLPGFESHIPDKEKAAEAYTLQVTAGKITVRATTRHGIYNGLQTLRQLIRGSLVDNCTISDYPSFIWRGYMIDAGRNYQPLELIKKQIDVMAASKMNVFHFHLTEDVAWRLAIKRYPQLTSAASMTRDQGLFYTRQDIKALIQYCKDRFITFIPEIDMPGHSAAFKRAMGFDMQSDSGMIVLKDILNEVCQTYALPYIHIGADEVHIHNKNFLPAVMKLLTSKGKKIIGWEPGGQYSSAVYRQLWGDNKEKNNPAEILKKIDSRNLYINHMDPEESVISIYNHELDDRQSGDTNNIGGTLCLWNDRKLADPFGNLKQNPTIPALLAFAEKSWCGKGVAGNLIGLGHLNQIQRKDFAAFEDRLLSIQKIFYKDLPFPYIRQSNIHWQLIGPFDNKGNLKEVFGPEQQQQDLKKYQGDSITGGSIILRHFWHPAAKGLLDTPTANTTYYAKGQYWSAVDTTVFLWVGFYDYSRSTATAPPPAGSWNNLESKIWLNGQKIAPPQWQRARQGADLEIPYVDENYYFRPPVKVPLKKGWNQLLLKMPVGTFKAKRWYAPVKWMFSAMFIQPQPGSEVNNWEQNHYLYNNKP